MLDALRAARAAARERAWGLGVRPERIVIDIDATLVNAHTEKEGAAVNYRSGFGFHPILAYLDETHEALGRGAAEEVARRLIQPRRRSMFSTWRSRSYRSRSSAISIPRS